MAASITPAELALPSAPRPFRLRIIPPIETYPAVVAFAQTALGKAAMLSVFALGLSFYMTHWKVMALWLLLITLLPHRRRLLVTIGLFQWTFLMPLERVEFDPMVLMPLVQKAAACAIGGLLFYGAIRFERTILGRRPILSLLSGYAAFVFVASTLFRAHPQYHTLWAFTVTFSFYIWFIGYALMDRSASSRDPFYLQLGTFHPFWGSTHVPIPKGSAYLRKIEARTPEKLAITQLKAVKLLAWGLLLNQLLKVGQTLVYGRLAIPTFAVAFDHIAKGSPDKTLICWLSLISSFIEAALVLTVKGHRIIACCRMAGFLALRNTYSPFASRTIADFWNRYYYYFKELLADFFFYPAFIRFFKGNSKVRLAFATLAAATFGNMFYHFFNEPDTIARLGFWNAIVAFQPYMFYALVLGIGVAVSQMRRKKPVHTGWFRARLVPCFCVTSFFCLLHVFCDSSRTYPISVHFRYFARLFNLPI